MQTILQTKIPGHNAGAGQSPRHLRSRRQAADRRHRPDQRVRRRHGQRHSLQGHRPDADLQVLVRLPGRPGRAPSALRQRRGPPQAVLELRASSSRAAACWSARSRSCRSSASCAATWPAPAGRNTSRAAPSAASSCPPGLKQCQKLPEPIFTPVHQGRARHPRREHQLRRGRQDRRRRPGDATSATRASRSSRRPGRYAESRGLILADTKFEWGLTRRRQDHPDRRGPHAGLVAVLARRQVRPRPRPGELRQAVRPQLARRDPLQQVRPRRRAAARHRREDRAKSTSRPTNV